jgi:hypothetical protein
MRCVLIGIIEESSKMVGLKTKLILRKVFKIILYFIKKITYKVEYIIL